MTRRLPPRTSAAKRRRVPPGPGRSRREALRAGAVFTVAAAIGGSESRASDEEGKGGAVAPGLQGAHLRVARPTDRLEAVVAFYRDGLGLERLDHFEGHEGFDGVMLGHRRGAFHLEFTRHAGHPAGKAPTEDNLLVFYLPDAQEWARAVARMEQAGYRAVKAWNPYWDKNGRTFADPDGYRVVLQQARWAPPEG